MSTVVSVVKCGSEAWTLRKPDARCFLRIVRRNPGTRLTNRISNSRLYEKCCSIPLSAVIMIKRLRWLGHVLRMTDCQRLSNANRQGLKRKQVVHSQDVIKKYLWEMGTSWEGGKRIVSIRLGWWRSVLSCVGLEPALWQGELLVVIVILLSLASKC